MTDQQKLLLDGLEELLENEKAKSLSEFFINAMCIEEIRTATTTNEMASDISMIIHFLQDAQETLKRDK